MNTVNFKHNIELLTKSSNIGLYIIHLDRAIERLPLITQLEDSLNIKLNIFKGADGYELIKEGHPTTCQQRGPPATRGPGDIGCTVSHINVCKDALSKNYDYIVIFEDDCIFTSELSILYSLFNQFIKLDRSWDLFLLGMDVIHSQGIPNTSILKVFEFNCTHACILSKKFMNELVKTYEDYYANNVTLSIDTLYSNILKIPSINAYGFNNHKVFIQQPGIYSYIVENIR